MRGFWPPRSSSRLTALLATLVYRALAGSLSLYLDTIGENATYIGAPRTSGRERVGVIRGNRSGRRVLYRRDTLRSCCLRVRGREASPQRPRAVTERTYVPTTAAGGTICWSPCTSIQLCHHTRERGEKIFRPCVSVLSVSHLCARSALMVSQSTYLRCAELGSRPSIGLSVAARR